VPGGCVAMTDVGETWAVLTKGLVRAYCVSRDLFYGWLLVEDDKFEEVVTRYRGWGC
jgi:hypothetical protein